MLNLNPNMNLVFGMNPNVNFLLEMNNNPHINNPPNMVPAGSLNIPRFEDTPAGRSFEERRNRFTPPVYVPPKIPEYVLPAYIPPKIPEYTPKTYLPPEYKLPKF